MSTLLGSELVDEVFESEGPDASEDVLPVSEGVVHERDVNIQNGSLSTAPLNAMRSFEVFLGRRFDPAEGELLTSDGDGELSSQPIVRPSQNTTEVLAVAAAVERGHGKRALDVSQRAAMEALETPLQRYHRLANELAGLEAELKAVAAADTRRPSRATPVDPAVGVWRTLTAGVTDLSARLDGLRPALGTFTSGEGGSAIAEPSGAPRSEVATGAPAAVSPLDDIIASLRRMEIELSATPSPPASATAVHAASASAPAAASIAAVELEARLAAVETALLVSEDPVAAVAAGSSSRGANAAATRVAALERRVSLLQEPGALEGVAGRARAAAAAVAAAAAAGPASPPSSAAGRVGSSPAASGGAGAPQLAVSAGYTLVSDARLSGAVQALERWDGVAAALPHVADRLQSLREVHREARAVPGRLTALEAAVRGLDAQLGSDTALLRELQAGLLDLAHTVQANLALLTPAWGAGSGKA